MRSEFLAANRGWRAPTPSFVLLVHPRHDGSPRMGIGLTVSKKVGKAVSRNRIKRRLRDLVRSLLPQVGIVGANHIIIARPREKEQGFALLERDLSQALDRAHRYMSRQASRSASRNSRDDKNSKPINSKPSGDMPNGL